MTGCERTAGVQPWSENWYHDSSGGEEGKNERGLAGNQECACEYAILLQDCMFASAYLLTELKRCRWSADRFIDSRRACEALPLALVCADWGWGCDWEAWETFVRMVKSHPLIALSEELTRFSPGGPGMCPKGGSPCPWPWPGPSRLW